MEPGPGGISCSRKGVLHRVRSPALTAPCSLLWLLWQGAGSWLVRSACGSPSARCSAQAHPAQLGGRMGSELESSQVTGLLTGAKSAPETGWHREEAPGRGPASPSDCQVHCALSHVRPQEQKTTSCTEFYLNSRDDLVSFF